MRNPTLTQSTILVVVAFLIVYDIIVGVTYGVQTTLSQVMLEWSKARPLLVFVVGALCGHLFIDSLGIPPIDRARAKFFFACKEMPELMGAAYFLSALIPWPARYPLLVLICGALAGYFCWPQSAELGR